MRLIAVLDMTIWTLSASLNNYNINSGVRLSHWTIRQINGQIWRNHFWVDWTIQQISVFPTLHSTVILKFLNQTQVLVVTMLQQMRCSCQKCDQEMVSGEEENAQSFDPNPLITVHCSVYRGSYLNCTIQYLAIVELTVFRLVWAKCPIVWAQYSSNCTFLVSSFSLSAAASTSVEKTLNWLTLPDSADSSGDTHTFLLFSNLLANNRSLAVKSYLLPIRWSPSLTNVRITHIPWHLWEWQESILDQRGLGRKPEGLL